MNGHDTVFMFLKIDIALYTSQIYVTADHQSTVLDNYIRDISEFTTLLAVFVPAEGRILITFIFMITKCHT